MFFCLLAFALTLEMYSISLLFDFMNIYIWLHRKKIQNSRPDLKQCMNVNLCVRKIHLFSATVWRKMNVKNRNTFIKRRLTLYVPVVHEARHQCICEHSKIHSKWQRKKWSTAEMANQIHSQAVLICHWKGLEQQTDTSMENKNI